MKEPAESDGLLLRREGFEAMNGDGLGEDRTLELNGDAALPVGDGFGKRVVDAIADKAAVTTAATDAHPQLEVSGTHGSGVVEGVSGDVSGRAC
jgi:hypothetical protein